MNISNQVYQALQPILGLPEENVHSCSINLEVNKIATVILEIQTGINEDGPIYTKQLFEIIPIDENDI